MPKKPRPWAGHARCPKNGKLRYRSLETAEKMLAQIIVHGAARYVPRRAYLCETCGGWHLTSQERRETAA
jgi:hypothetical protein